MTDNAGDARAGIAQAVDDMSASTRALIHEEIQAAQREAWQRAKELAPGGAMLAGAGVLGVFAAAAAFRLGLRALEKMTGPAAAAAIGLVGFGAAGGFAAVAGLRWLRESRSPVPADTLRRAGTAIRHAAQRA